MSTSEMIQITVLDVPPPIVLQAITVTPAGVRFTATGAQRPLTVTGQLSNDTTQDLTTASGTTYDSSNAFVASVSAHGVVTAVDNGDTTITVQHQTFSAPVSVTVEVGVTLTMLDLSPPAATLRAAGATQPLHLTGTFSDGSTRDLTAATTGTTYTASAPGVATVSPDGVVTAVANGPSTITAAHEQHSASAQITVAISSGPGFLRGEVYDDSLGLPLAHATVTLLADGSGPLVVTADAQGQFLMPGMAGDAVVRIDAPVDTPGFTSVERQGVIPPSTALTLLDARLTPFDARPNPLPAALGGQARNLAHTLSLEVAPGSLAADTDIRLTAISNQGLQGRLPLGWSPIAVVDVQPAGLLLSQPALLRVPNSLSLPPGRAVTAVFYDAPAHRWTALAPAQVTTDGMQIMCALPASGQVALLLPDAVPFTPLSPQIGQMLVGVAPVPLPTTIPATKDVVPRSAPAGEGARADGTVILKTAGAFPSGTQVQARAK